MTGIKRKSGIIQGELNIKTLDEMLQPRTQNHQLHKPDRMNCKFPFIFKNHKNRGKHNSDAQFIYFMRLCERTDKQTGTETKQTHDRACLCDFLKSKYVRKQMRT